MTSSEGTLSALRKTRQIELSVKGRVSGRVSSRPVWFVLSKDDKSLFLIPVKGRKTQWYLNIKKEPEVTVRVGGHAITGRIAEVEPGRFKEVLAAFTARYGKEDMEAYYPRKEVALEIPLPTSS